MIRQCAAILAASLTLIAMPHAPAHAADAPLVPGYRPAAESDEAGLWMAVDRAEIFFQQSPLTVRDEALNAYVKEVLCSLAGPQCDSVRLYIIDDPSFNAAAYPNGMVHVNTGLLLRAQNEAQLASVLGHEITHYTERHTLQQFRSARNTSTVLAFLSLGVAGVSVSTGVNYMGAADLASVVATLSFYSYSREQEREADFGGFHLMVAHGYDGHASAEIWRNVWHEAEANPDRRGAGLFLRTHPTEEERIQNLTELADAQESPAAPAQTGADRYREIVLPHRGDWLERELGRARYEESIALISRLIQLDPNSGELRFFLGEAHRRRNAEGDPDLALTAYRAAIATAEVPSEAYRGLGMVALKEGDMELARQSFEQYLMLAPEADDRAMVQLYLSRTGG